MSKIYQVFILSVMFFSACEEEKNITDVSSPISEKVEYPCLDASSECLSTYKVGIGGVQVYSSFHLDSASNVKNAIIVVHGNNRNADDYFSNMISTIISLGLENEVLVVSPRFITQGERTLDSDWYWNTTSWKWGNQSYSQSGLNIGSFAVIDTILKGLNSENKHPNLESILITGHSSGAAFTQLYSATKENNNYMDTDLEFAVMNSQYFLYADSNRLQNNQLLPLESCSNYNDWPSGFSNLNPYLLNISKVKSQNNFINNKVTYFIGTSDISADGIQSGCKYSTLGINRYEKTKNFVTYMDLTFDENKHDKIEINGIGHSSSGMYSSTDFKTYLNIIFQQ